MTAANADTAGKTAAEKVPPQSGEVAMAAGAGRETVLATEHGKTTIADVVVQKIAGLAAREISGVHKLGGGVARAFGVVMERVRSWER